MQLQLDDTALFMRIAELGTLSAAARERDVPVSQVTRALARLEKACGVRLLHRTTHGLSLTDEGDTFLAYCRRMGELTAELGSELTGKLNQPSGWVRVGASQVLSQFVLAPSLAGLYARHPQLHIELAASDRLADMARDGLDIAIRSGDVGSDTLVARRIGTHHRSLYAAPAYLAQFGTPQHPDDLARHRLLANSASPVLNHWGLAPPPAGPGGSLHVPGHTRADSTALLLALVLQGVGIGRLMDLVARPLVHTGQLVPVLSAHFSDPQVAIHAVMLKERQRLPKIRACIDYWEHWLNQPSFTAA